MNKPVAPGRIRWAVLCLALAASGARCPPPPRRERRSASRSSSRWTPAAPPPPARPPSAPRAARSPATCRSSTASPPKLPAGAVDALEDADGVKAVTVDNAVKPQGVSLSRLQTAYPASVDAPQVWNNPIADVSGRGVGVAVIDTGIAGGMPDFRASGSSSSRVVANAVTNPDARTPGDAYGHGTHVAGIIAGNGWNRSYTDPLRGKYVGIAPEANLISVKVSDDQGEASVLDVIYGLQFVVDNKAAYNIRVVNLSLESTTPGSYKTDPLNAAVESAWFKGIVVVTAAGNRGSADDAVSRAPGNDPYVITVGAYDDQASNADGDDSRPAWSSRGITADGFAKPEIHAPGSGIVSTLAPNSAFASMCPSVRRRRPDDPRRRHLDGRPDDHGHGRAAAAALPAAQARPGQGHAHAQRPPDQQPLPGGRGLQDARGGLLRAHRADQHGRPDPERDRQRRARARSTTRARAGAAPPGARPTAA